LEEHGSSRSTRSSRLARLARQSRTCRVESSRVESSQLEWGTFQTHTSTTFTFIEGAKESLNQNNYDIFWQEVHTFYDFR